MRPGCRRKGSDLRSEFQATCLRELLGSQFHAGIVLYDGEHVLPLGDQQLAVPLSALWARKSKSAGKRKLVTRRGTPAS